MPCDQCNDTGWVFEPGGVRDCECKRVRIFEFKLKKAGLPERYQQASFDTFNAEAGGPDVRKAAHIVERFVDEYPTQHDKGILLTGPCGTGKTHLAIAALRELTLRYGVQTAFTDVRLLLKSLQETYQRGADMTEAAVLAPILTAEAAVLDELGAARATDWSADVIEHIINTRYNRALCTIVTSNLANLPQGAAASASSARSSSYAEAIREVTRQETLGDRIGARMFSRLQEMCIHVTVNGEDYRRKGIHNARALY